MLAGAKPDNRRICKPNEPKELGRLGRALLRLHRVNSPGSRSHSPRGAVLDAGKHVGKHGAFAKRKWKQHCLMVNRGLRQSRIPPLAGMIHFPGETEARLIDHESEIGFRRDLQNAGVAAVRANFYSSGGVSSRPRPATVAGAINITSDKI